ncbi:MAG: autotransporter-associated beta strand repeat-containing protein [Luteolibacter sp.]
MKSRFLPLLTVVCFSLRAHAADGTWTNLTSGGLWSDTANWSGGTIADGSGFTANFNTLNLTADNTVHLDGAHTLTNLIFGDTTTSTAGGWILDNNGNAANILTLAGTTPTITVNALGTNKSATISAVIDGTVGLTKAGAGNLVLSAVNTYTGATTVSAGTLTMGVNNALNSSSTLAFSSSGTSGTLGTVDIGATSQTIAGLTVNGYNPSNNSTTTAVIKGSGSLSVAGTSDFSVWNTSTQTAGASTMRVVLDMTALSSFSYSATANNVIVGGNGNTRAGTLSLGTTSSFTAKAFSLQDGGAGSNTAKTSIVNLGQATTINADTIYVLNNNNKDSATFQFRTGLASNPTLTIRATNGTGRAAWNVGTTATGTGTALVDLTTGVTGASQLDALVGTLQVGQKTAGANAFTSNFLMGGGTLDATTLNVGTISISGGTLNSTFSVTGGTVKVTTLNMGTQSSGTLNSTFNLNSGATLAAQTIQNGSGTATRTFNWNDGTIKNYDASTDLTVSSALKLAASGSHTFDIGTGRTGTVSGVISEAAAGASLTKTGAGQLTLSAANSHSGTTTVSNGTLALSGSGTLGASSVTLAITGSSAILNLGGTSQTVGGVTLGGGTIQNGTLTGTSYTSTGGSISASLAGSAGFSQASGTTTLTGINSYTGTTTISGGKLLVNGSLGNTLTSIQTGAILGGSGTIAGTTTIESGGTLSPGNSPGVITFSNGLNLQAGSNLDWQFTGDTLATRGTDYDGVDVTGGTLVLDTGSILNLLATGTDYTASVWDSNRSFKVINVTGDGSYDGNGNFTLVTTGAGDFAAEGAWGLTYDTTGVTLNWVAVPEPSTALLGGLGLLVVLRRRR